MEGDGVENKLRKRQIGKNQRLRDPRLISMKKKAAVVTVKMCRKLAILFG